MRVQQFLIKKKEKDILILYKVCEILGNQLVLYFLY